MSVQSDYLIRDARPGEFDAAAKIMLAAYEQYKAYMPPPAWEAYSKDLVDVGSRAEASQLIVAEQDGRLLGAVTFFPDAPQGENWPDGYTYVRLLAVAPTGRGRGIGRALMEECIERSRTLQATYIALHTTGIMEVARSMYERMGFQRVPAHDFKPAPQITVEAFRLKL